MKYYKATADAYDYFNKNGIVANELLTERERHSRVRYILDYYFTVVDIPKNRTFKNFGVRFEIKE